MPIKTLGFLIRFLKYGFRCWVLQVSAFQGTRLDESPSVIQDLIRVRVQGDSVIGFRV